MLRLLLVWAINALVLYWLPAVVPGITIDGFGAALVAVAVLGLVNAVIRPVFVLLTLPVTVLTLGLFLFVINALMFWFVGDLLRGFRVDGFGPALLGSLLYSAATWALATLTGARRQSITVTRIDR